MTNYPIAERVAPFLAANPDKWHSIGAIAIGTHLVAGQVEEQLAKLVSSGAVERDEGWLYRWASDRVAQREMKSDPYTYRDFATRKVRRTHGAFESWQGPTGPLNVFYAVFRTRATVLCVPEYALTPETRQRLPRRPEATEGGRDE